MEKREVKNHRMESKIWTFLQHEGEKQDFSPFTTNLTNNVIVGRSLVLQKKTFLHYSYKNSAFLLPKTFHTDKGVKNEKSLYTSCGCQCLGVLTQSSLMQEIKTEDQDNRPRQSLSCRQINSAVDRLPAGGVSESQSLTVCQQGQISCRQTCTYLHIRL